MKTRFTKLFLSVFTLTLFSFGLSAQQQIVEDFESLAKTQTSYTAADVATSNGTWAIAAVTTKDDNDHINGSIGIRFRGNSTNDNHYVAMKWDKTGGIGTVTFKYASYSSHKNGVIQLQYSEGGDTWVNVGDPITAPVWDAATGMLTASIDVNNSNAKRIRIQKVSATSGSVSVNIDDITIGSYSGAATNVSAPTFSPIGGDYLNPQTVTINCTTAGAIVRYTLDGTDPTESSAQYSTPLSISTTTTLKARGYKDGLQPSAVATAQYDFPEAISTLADLRAKGSGALVKYTGTAIVTLAATSTTGNRNTKYIQDATGAMVIDDASGVITGTYAIGDQISNITGTLGNYNGMLQLVPLTDATKGTSGNTVQPTVKSLANLAVTDQAKLIGIPNVQLDATAGTFVKGTNTPVTGSTSVVVRPQYFDLNYIGTNIPATAIDLVGVMLVYNETMQIVPRSLADILPAGTLGLVNAKLDGLNVYAENGTIFVKNLTEAAKISIYDLTGRLVTSTTATTIPVTKGGIYVVKVGDKAFKVINQ